MSRRKVLMVTRKTIVEDGIYHITQRAPGRELLFIEDSDYLIFLRLMKKTVKKFSLDVFCFALLSNHLHLLLKIKNRNLDKAMKYLFQSYAQTFNKKYQRKGHVFCGVYRASLCKDDSYLITTSLYIHLNPYKAGLADSPVRYKWFSLQPYIKPIKSSFLNTDFILDVLYGRNKDRARTIYRRLIRESSNFKYGNFLEDNNAVKRFSEEALYWFKKNILRLDLSRISGFNSYFELERRIEEAKRKKRWDKPESQKAVLYLIEQLKAKGYSIKDIADKLRVGRTSIYRILKLKH